MPKIGQRDLKTDLHICSPHREGHLCLTSVPYRNSSFFPALLTDNCYVVNGDTDNELRKPVFGVLRWKTERPETKGTSSPSLYNSL